MIKAIFLDFDGVILESVDVKTEVFKELFSRYTKNINAVLEYHLKNNGVSRFLKFKHIWENIVGRKYDSLVEKDLAMEFFKISTERVSLCPFVAGAEAFIKDFFKKFPLYVASAVPLEELNVIIYNKGLKHFFAGIFGYPPITKIQAISRIIRDDSLAPKEVLFIGDSLQDYQAALKTGVNFIGRKNKDDFEGLEIPVFHDMELISDFVKHNFIGGL